MKGAEGVGGARQSQMPQKCPETGLKIFHWIDSAMDRPALATPGQLHERSVRPCYSVLRSRIAKKGVNVIQKGMVASGLGE